MTEPDYDLSSRQSFEIFGNAEKSYHLSYFLTHEIATNMHYLYTKM